MVLMINHIMENNRRLHLVKRIALVAHDNKKADLIDWAYYNRTVLTQHELIATGTTGKLLEENLNYPVRKLFSGPLGGDQQLGAMIAEGKVDIIIFFWDPMEAQPHDSDVKALLRVAIAWNCIVACDRATADFVLTSPMMQEQYELVVPDYMDYLKREV
jgi:methylglyoxal synthase